MVGRCGERQPVAWPDTLAAGQARRESGCALVTQPAMHKRICPQVFNSVDVQGQCKRAIGSDGNMFRANADSDSLFAVWRHPKARSVESYSLLGMCVAARDPSRQKVHRWRADKSGNELVGRAFVDLQRRARSVQFAPCS